MGRISTSVGLISGINTRDIIDQLMSIEEAPKKRLQTQIDSANEERLAFVDFSTRLTSLKISGTTLKKTSTFEAATASSSDENVLSATTSAGATVGSFQFRVARLVTSQQSITRGFADADTTRVGAGTLTFETGGGDLKSRTQLSDLNGGAGVQRGSFRITDRSGASAVVDISSAVNLDDAVRKINNSLGVSVRAAIVGDKLKLTDLTGRTTTDLSVQDLGGGSAAAGLGLTTDTDVDANTLTGADINFVGRNTSLATLNDGRGIRKAASGNDFSIALADGTSINLAVGSKQTVGEILDALNTLGAGKLRASVPAGSNAVRLEDLTTGGGSFAVTAVVGSSAANDLGILQSTTGGGTINGKQIIAQLGSVLVSSLKGGAGINLGNVSITDRTGASATVDLSAATSVQGILDAISNASGINVTASLNQAGNGIQITDDTTGTGNIVIADADGTNSATALGINGTFDLATPVVKGANLQLQWVSENSLLKDYNGGKGVSAGKFKITTGSGVVASFDFSDGAPVRLSDVINTINTRAIGVTASINTNGDGLLLTDTTVGAGHLKIEDVEGQTAKDLNIKGTATTNTIDGSFEKTVTIAATDTLTEVQSKINTLGFGVTAAIINDGTGASPYRLSLNARNSGVHGRVVIDAGATALGATNLVNAQDAAVFVGSPEATAPLLVTANSNQISGVVRGVNIELNGVSETAVTLNIARSADNVVEQVTQFTDTFNAMVDKFKELTKFDTSTYERGLLLGNSTEQTVEATVYSMVNSVVGDAGRFKVLADLGISLNRDSKIDFDEEKFREAYSSDPEAVKQLFTATQSTVNGDGTTTTVGKGIGWLIETKATKLIDPVSGVITRQNKTIDNKTREFQSRIDSLDKLLAGKRTRLERQFANMESILSKLQSQSSSIGQIGAATASK